MKLCQHLIGKPMVSVLLLLVLLSGCAATGPIYQAAPEPKESDALIYIYRPNSFALGGRDAYFYVDDVNIVDLSNEGYTWFHLPAGEYSLKQKWPLDVTLGTHTIEIKVKWLPHQKYYYRLNTNVGFGYQIGYSTIKYEWQLTEVPVEQAVGEISTCKLQAASGMQKVIGELKR